MKLSALKKSFISHKFDILLIVVILLVALGLFFIIKNNKKVGGYVEVKQGKKIVDVLPLDQDIEKTYKNLYGKNTLIIKDGCAYVVDASCKDEICEKTGKISKEGETIICLPNELFIKIVGGKKGDYDEVVK